MSRFGRSMVFAVLLAAAFAACRGGDGGSPDGGGGTAGTACIFDSPATTWDNCSWSN